MSEFGIKIQNEFKLSINNIITTIENMQNNANTKFEKHEHIINSLSKSSKATSEYITND